MRLAYFFAVQTKNVLFQLCEQICRRHGGEIDIVRVFTENAAQFPLFIVQCLELLQPFIASISQLLQQITESLLVLKQTQVLSRLEKTHKLK